MIEEHEGPALGDVEFDRARLAAVLETAVDAIVIIDERGIVATANPATERLFGYAISELVGQNVSMLMPEPHRSAHDGYLQHYLETGVRKIIGIGREVVARHKDGTPIHVELAVSHMQVGGQTYFSGMLRDVCERKRQQEALTVERDFVAALLDTTGGLVVVLDDQGKIVRFNRACEEMTGYEEGEVKGRTVTELFVRGDEAESFEKDITTLAVGEPGSSFENRWRDREDAVHLVSWANRRMVGPMGREFVISTGIEITERWKMHQQIAQQEKLAAIGQLAAGVAHEIGNPLASISAVVQTMRRKIEGDYAAGKLDLIATHIDRISTIVRQMVDFARPASVNWVRCSLNDVLNETLEIARFDRRAKGVEIDCQLDDGLPTFAVRDQIGQLLLNVFLNAFDAMSASDVAKRRLAIRSRSVEWKGAPAIEIDVTDNGVGLSKDAAKRVFEPFYTTKDVGQGTGLGLAVSYGIVQDHGGEITLNPASGGGCTVRIVLPVRERNPLGDSRS